jgi:spore coat protein H
VTRFSLLCLVLTGFMAVAGCGETDSSSGDRGGVGGTGLGASGGQAGFAGEAQGGASAVGEELYDTVDEGVFPKNRVLDIQVTMAAADWTNLIATAAQEVWSSADVTIDNQSVGRIGIRPKGEYSLDSCIDDAGNLVCEKLSLKLKFDHSDPEGRFYGLKKLNLNNILDGGTLYTETLGYQIYNDFGIIAPRTSYATITVNGAAQGIYRVVEAVDGRFTKAHFANGDGNLYKEAWPARTDESYFAVALETNDDTATHEAFIVFATDMLAATDEELPATLSKYMNLDKVLDYMAVDYGIANWDGITTFYAGDWGQANHNYFMYQAEGGSTFTLIPWDLNATFLLDHWLGDIQPWDTLDADCGARIPTRDDATLYTIPSSCDPMIRAIALSKDGYHASVQRLLDEVFVLDKLNEQVDAYAAQVSDVMANDPFMSAGDVAGGADYIKSQLVILRDRLQAVVAAE